MTRQSLVHKCLLKSEKEVCILYKRVWSDQETGSRNEGGGATSSEAGPEYFGAKWRLAYCYKGRLVDPKISCVIIAWKTWIPFAVAPSLINENLNNALFNGIAHFKNKNNCLNTNIYSYLDTSGRLNSSLYLNVVHFFNTSVN